MFHHGGLIDSRARKINDRVELRVYIAGELFFTCVEIHRVCVLFNSADTRVLSDTTGEEERIVLERVCDHHAIAQRHRDFELSLGDVPDPHSDRGQSR